MLFWMLESIDFFCIDKVCICYNEDLFFLLCSLFFVESGLDLYMYNLVNYFVGDEVLQIWFSQYWEYEELQYGCVLVIYVCMVWLEFDWEVGFKVFWDEYGVVCIVEQLEFLCGLELVVCCVVEIGIVSFYCVFNDIIDELVFKQFINYIKSDEVCYYKYFYQYYWFYWECEGFGCIKVFCVILCWVNEIKSEDSDIVLCYVFNQCYFDGSDMQFCQISNCVQGLLWWNILVEMMVKMLFKLLDLLMCVQNVLEKLLVKIVEKLFLY